MDSISTAKPTRERAAAQRGRDDSQDIVVSRADSLEEALGLAHDRRCEVLLVSATIPDDGALEIVRSVAQAEPAVKILVLDLAQARQPATRYIEAGAAGWLL